MPDELTILIAQEVAKQVPVRDIYQDALSPAFKQAGSAIEDIVKTCRLALAPFQFAALGQDRLQRFIQESKARVAEERLVLPPTQILGPVLEGIRYEPEGTISEEAFSRLLSAAFDREREGQAHPAFPHIIRSLAPDELRLLRSLSNRCYVLVLSRRSLSTTVLIDIRGQAWLFPELDTPEQILVYANHLEALGLILDLKAQVWRRFEEDGVPVVEFCYALQLSDFGTLFVTASLLEAGTVG